jgi:replicative DNA helicase
MVRHDGCEMVGIDTINQVQGDGKSEYEQLLPSCKALNELIPELQVPFLVTAQLNGKDYRGDKEPCLADIKGLGKLSTDAKFVMLMWWRAGLGTQDAPRVDLLIPKNSCGNGVRAEKGDAVKLVGSERYSWDEVGADYRDTKRAAQDDDEIDPYHD